MSNLIPTNEVERLQRLKSYKILDTVAESMFDDLTSLTANLLDVPIVLISLLDEKRQWFKSKYGLEEPYTSRDISFCQYTIMDNQIFEVEDAIKDDRFKNNPLVTGDPGIRFYAGSPLEDKDGLVIGTLCAIDRKPRVLDNFQKESLSKISRTILKLIKLRKESEDLKKIANARKDFLSQMSHEIRTPLNAIVGFNGLLSETDLNPIQKKYTSIVGSSCEHLMHLVNNTLDINKIESDQFTVERKSFNLHDTLKKCIELYRLMAESKDIHLTWEHDFSIPKQLVGDANRLSQIINNLISNAIKFTKFGQVKLYTYLESIRSNEIVVNFKVKDDGIGISESKLDAIFEPFTQIEGIENSELKGSGLGLYISKLLVNKMGGNITIDSVIGTGTTISFALPLIKVEKEDQNKKTKNIESKKLSYNLNKTSILLVEDNVNNQILANYIIEKYNGHCDIAENGEEALEKVFRKNYDLILMDLQMPKLNGYETSKILRNEMAFNNPIIACSAHASNEERFKCIEIGMNDYVVKPYSQNDLIEVIVKHVENQKLVC